MKIQWKTKCQLPAQCENLMPKYVTRIGFMHTLCACWLSSRVEGNSWMLSLRWSSSFATGTQQVFAGNANNCLKEIQWGEMLTLSGWRRNLDCMLWWVDSTALPTSIVPACHKVEFRLHGEYLGSVTVLRGWNWQLL